MNRPFIYLYKWEDSQFIQIAVIDDYEDVSWETRLYEAGTFTLQINSNLPNADMIVKGLFVRVGEDPYKFGEINNIENSLGNAGKGEQYKIATGFDMRYIFHKRIIKNLNSSESWTYDGSGELCMRKLISSQCGEDEIDTKRKLPVLNQIPLVGVGASYVVNEAYSNLYDVLVTIATQTQVGWRINFSGTLQLEIFIGTNKSNYIRFDTTMQTLDSGSFTDSNDEFTNAVYIGGKGNGNDRDIYEAEEEGAEGLFRSESWMDNEELTNEDQYRVEAMNILRQYSQTISISGKGLQKSPYVFDEDFFVGDIVNFSFSRITANVPVLSVTQHWSKGEYNEDMEIGKPLSDVKRQLSLLLKKIQSASSSIASKTTSSTIWYDIPVDREMKADEVVYDVIGFYDNVGTGRTFKLYFNSNGTGSKIYHVYLRDLQGTGQLTLTTGMSGAQNLSLNSGTYVTIIYVDNEGNISTIA